MDESPSAWSVLVDLLSAGDEVSVPARYDAFSNCVQDALEIIGEDDLDPGSGIVPNTKVSDLLALTKRSADDVLSNQQAAIAVAHALDEVYHLSFGGHWLADLGETFELTPGDWYPVPEQRRLGTLLPTSRPESLAVRPGEAAHARRFDGVIRVTFDSRFADQVDDVCGSLQRVATLSPRPGSTRRDVPLVELATAAFVDGATVAVAPELAAENLDLEIVWPNVPSGCLLAPGSQYLSIEGNEVNRVTLGFGTEIQTQLRYRSISFHDKFSPFVVDGEAENITPRPPHLTVLAGQRYRIAALVCKDLLSPDVTATLGRLGISLLVVPALSAKVDGFVAAAEFLASHSQTVSVCANGHSGGDLVGGIVGRPVRRDTVATHDVLTAPGYVIYMLDQLWSAQEPPLNPRVKHM